MQTRSREPILNAPSVVTATLGVLVAVHVALALVSDRTWAETIEIMALIPSRFSGESAHISGGEAAILTSLVTHQLVHGDVPHLIINLAWLLAFGSAVASRIGAVRFLVFALLSGVAGGLAYVAMHFGQNVVMVGASGALAGLMGGAFRFLFSGFDGGGIDAFRNNPRSIRRMSLGELARDGRARMAIGFWIALNFATALIAPWITSAGGIAWEAHLGGFLFGLLAFGLFDPPAPALPSNPRPTMH